MKDLLKKLEALQKESEELKMMVKALREWVREDAKEIKKLEDKLKEHRKL